MESDPDYIARRRLSFGSVAELYDRTRPDYPQALVRDVLDHAAAGAMPATGGALRALEVGAGTGKATLQFAAHGIAIHAIEPSAGMAQVLARRCEGRPAVTIEQAEFEAADLAPGTFELVYSAQAWHWADPDRRSWIARAALVDGGSLAAFWNGADWTRCPLAEPLVEVYARVGVAMPLQGPMVPGEPARMDLADEWAAEIAATDGLAEAETRGYEWSTSYTTAEYLELLQTHSDHLLLPNAVREPLWRAIADVIDGAGGVLDFPYRTGLCLARAY